jgi:hypothetical protein
LLPRANGIGLMVSAISNARQPNLQTSPRITDSKALSIKISVRHQHGLCPIKQGCPSMLAALQEATETLVQTAKEAGTGDFRLRGYLQKRLLQNQ